MFFVKCEPIPIPIANVLYIIYIFLNEISNRTNIETSTDHGQKRLTFFFLGACSNQAGPL